MDDIDRAKVLGGPLSGKVPMHRRMCHLNGELDQ